VNEPAGRNESEPQSMSLENYRPGEKPSRYLNGEGRRAQSRQPSASERNSGGVSVDSTPGSNARVSWESCGGGKAQASAQAGRTGKAGEITAAVGDRHSSAKARREATCSMRKSGGGGLGMAGASRILTPKTTPRLQPCALLQSESNVMNELGEPNTGNPSVRFDEGRVSDGHWRFTPLNPSSPPTLLNRTRSNPEKARRPLSRRDSPTIAPGFNPG